MIYLTKQFVHKILHCYCKSSNKHEHQANPKASQKITRNSPSHCITTDHKEKPQTEYINQGFQQPTITHINKFTHKIIHSQSSNKHNRQTKSPNHPIQSKAKALKKVPGGRACEREHDRGRRGRRNAICGSDHRIQAP